MGKKIFSRSEGFSPQNSPKGLTTNFFCCIKIEYNRLNIVSNL